MEWESIYYDWLSWKLPLNIWYNAPDFVIFKTWQGVKKAREREINDQSWVNAQVASMVFNYIRDPKSSSSAKSSDFLPFEVEKKYESIVSVETAKIFIECQNQGWIAPHILKDFTSIPDLFETICKLGGDS